MVKNFCIKTQFIFFQGRGELTFTYNKRNIIAGIFNRNMKETSTRMLPYSVQSTDQLHCINLLSFVVKGLEIYKRQDYFMLAQLGFVEKLMMFLIIIKVYVFKNTHTPPQFITNFHRLQITTLYYLNFRTDLSLFLAF